MSTIITVENLGKKYILQQSRQDAKKINKKTLKDLAKSDIFSPTFSSLCLKRAVRAGGREIVSIL